MRPSSTAKVTRQLPGYRKPAIRLPEGRQGDERANRLQCPLPYPPFILAGWAA